MSERTSEKTSLSYDVIIIGAGISGIAMACQLKEKLGVTRFRIFEKQSGLGGTWWSHRYPGVACDVPAPLYSYSFAPNPSWSTLTPSGKDILDYLNDVGETYKIMESILFNTEVAELRWDGVNAEWEAKIVERTLDANTLAANKQTTTIRSKIVVSAVGKFNEPKLSALQDCPGIQDFKGQVIHTSRWDETISLKEKNVLVIGTGCSAAQLVPELLGGSIGVKSLTQLMRSPPWVTSKYLSPDGIFGETHILWMLRNVPGLTRVMRTVMFAVMETEYFRFYGANMLSRLCRAMRRRRFLEYMRRTVPNEYHAQLTPSYEVGCKRLIQDPGWFRSLNDPRLRLSTSKLKRIDQNAVILESDGRACRIATDAIILATGYETTSLLGSISIIGRGGTALHEIWAERGGPQAYLGVAMDKCPNLFFIFGPNSSAGHTTVLIGVENSVYYIVKLIRQILHNRVRTLEVKEKACTHWTSDVQAASRRSVWIDGGCHNWYVDSQRWNSMIYPFSQIYAIYKFAFPHWGDWNFTYTIPYHSRGSIFDTHLSLGACLLVTVFMSVYYFGLFQAVM